MPDYHDFVSNRNGAQCLECELAPDHTNHTRRLQEGAAIEWAGSTPFYLIFEPPDKRNIGIDLDAPGWIEANKELFRAVGMWVLMTKEGPRPFFTVFIRNGDQFYYAKRHVGNLMAQKEVVAVGIGKKQADGKTVNLWVMPNGMICGGDDVDYLGASMLGMKP